MVIPAMGIHTNCNGTQVDISRALQIVATHMLSDYKLDWIQDVPWGHGKKWMHIKAL